MADVVVAGGTEACVTPVTMAAFARWGAQPQPDPPPRPPLRRRPRRLRHGRGRGLPGARALRQRRRPGRRDPGRGRGYGLTCDAHHITAPVEDGSARWRRSRWPWPTPASRRPPSGTSTPTARRRPQRRAEAAAIAKVFGPARCRSRRARASPAPHRRRGAVEAVAALVAVDRGIVPPTANHARTDLPVDVVAGEVRRSSGRRPCRRRSPSAATTWPWCWSPSDAASGRHGDGRRRRRPAVARPADRPWPAGAVEAGVGVPPWLPWTGRSPGSAARRRPTRPRRPTSWPAPSGPASRPACPWSACWSTPARHRQRAGRPPRLGDGGPGAGRRVGPGAHRPRRRRALPRRSGAPAGLADVVVMTAAASRRSSTHRRASARITGRPSSTPTCWAARGSTAPAPASPTWWPRPRRGARPGRPAGPPAANNHEPPPRGLRRPRGPVEPAGGRHGPRRRARLLRRARRDRRRRRRRDVPRAAGPVRHQRGHRAGPHGRHAVGVLANQPSQLAGALDIEGSRRRGASSASATPSTCRSSRWSTRPASARGATRSGGA